MSKLPCILMCQSRWHYLADDSTLSPLLEPPHYAILEIMIINLTFLSNGEFVHFLYSMQIRCQS